jgi:DNA-binding NtrC family response regulator
MLRQHQYNKSKTARALAITRKTLAHKIDKYDLEASPGK